MSSKAIEDEATLQLTLQRLYEQIPNHSIQALMSAFAYNATLMDHYLSLEQRDLKKRYYLNIFSKIIEMFRQRISKQERKKSQGLSEQKKNILNDILKGLSKYSRASQLYHFRDQSSKKDLDTEVSQKISRILGYYNDHNLDKAYEQIQQLNHLTHQLPKLILTSEMRKSIDKVKEEYLKMVQFYSHFGGQDWIFDKEENNISLEYKVLEEERTIVIRMFAEIDMEMLPFLAIASEIDFQKEYVPFVYVSEEIKQLARNRKAGYSKTYVPLLTDRECYFNAVGYDRMETTGSIFLFTESYDEDLKLQKEYDLYVPNSEDSEYVRLKVHYFCLDYKPLSRTRASIKLVTKADFKLTFLPLWILQRSARYFTFNYFEKIVEKARDFKGSIWQQRVKQKPAMYNFFQKKIDEYLK